MFMNRPSLCSPTFSYHVNYEIQSRMYEWFDKLTDNRKDLKLSGFGVLYVSNIITLSTRVSAIGETFLCGIGLLFLALYENKHQNNLKLGAHEIFVHTPKNVLRLAFTPVEFIFGMISHFAEPKFLVMEVNECMKINLKHSLNETLNSKEHVDDLRFVQSDIKPKFMKYQKRVIYNLDKKSYPKTNTNAC